jgi:hypothetical protein
MIKIRIKMINERRSEREIREIDEESHAEELAAGVLLE